MSLASPHHPKQWFVIAMPTNTRAPSPVKVQVRGSRHLSLSTPWLHQGCDSPPLTGEQWPAPLSRRPDSGGLSYTHMNKHTRNHKGPPTAVWYEPFLTQSPAASREEKRFSPWRAPRNNHTPDLSVSSNCVQPSMFPNYSALPKWLRIIIRT